MNKAIDIRAHFPVLNQLVNGKPLCYLDSAASSQKPEVVIDAMSNYYRTIHANVHRGVHTLSQRATEAYESVRVKVASFIGASSSDEIIFTRGATESINLVSNSWGRSFLHEGDEVLITEMEHHANIVPWQLICQERKAVLRYIPITDEGELDLTEIDVLLNANTKLLAITHTSNSLGTINPLDSIIKKARSIGATVLVDGSQAVAHQPINVQALDADFFVFSSHKMYGPTGIGILFGKKDLLDKMPPWQGGGDMIKDVSLERSTYNDVPLRFEAGTPSIAEAIGLGAAIDFIYSVGFESIQNIEHNLLQNAEEELRKMPEISIFGRSSNKAPVISFLANGIHPYDLGTFLDQMGVAIRTGHHCTQPIMKRFHIPGTCRASFAVYNTEEDVNQFIQSLRKSIQMLS